MLINFFDKTMIIKIIEVILLSNIKILGAFIPISIGVIEKEDDIKYGVILFCDINVAKEGCTIVAIESECDYVKALFSNGLRLGF